MYPLLRREKAQMRMTSFAHFLLFFFCAAFFPFRRAKREIFVPPLRIFLSFFAFFDPNRRQGLEASGSRTKQKKDREEEKRRILLLFCVYELVRVKCRRTFWTLSCNKNYTNVIIKLSHKEKVQRERERKTRSLHVTVAKRTAERRTEVYTRRPVINACIWRGKETV